jgi:hypothetical protein
VIGTVASAASSACSMTTVSWPASAVMTIVCAEFVRRCPLTVNVNVPSGWRMRTTMTSFALVPKISKRRTGGGGGAGAGVSQKSDVELLSRRMSVLAAAAASSMARRSSRSMSCDVMADPRLNRPVEVWRVTGRGRIIPRQRPELRQCGVPHVSRG